MTQFLSLATRRYYIEPRTRKYVKGYDFYHLQENIKGKKI